MSPLTLLTPLFLVLGLSCGAPMSSYQGEYQYVMNRTETTNIPMFIIQILLQSIQSGLRSLVTRAGLRGRRTSVILSSSLTGDIEALCQMSHISAIQSPALWRCVECVIFIRPGQSPGVGEGAPPH